MGLFLKFLGVWLGVLARHLASAGMIILRAIGKFAITTWRLAAALDSALWRAFLLLLGRLAHASAHGLRLIAGICRSFVLWLPTRMGRAYSACSAIVLLVAGLWIVDELRAGVQPLTGVQGGSGSPLDRNDPILARIQGRYVHLSEIAASARATGDLAPEEGLSSSDAFERGLVQSYVEQRLLARAAEETGLHRSPVVSRRVNAARDRVLAASLIESQINQAVTPEKVEKFYLEQRRNTQLGDEVRARHILVQSEEEANSIIALLREGANFGELARERSQDRATAPLGGEVGWFSRPMMEAAFSNAAFSTKPGDYAKPFKSEFGWHVVEVIGRRPTAAKPFESVRSDIETFLRLQMIDETLSILEEDNQVIYYQPQDVNDAPRASIDATRRLAADTGNQPPR